MLAIDFRSEVAPNQMYRGTFDNAHDNNLSKNTKPKQKISPKQNNGESSMERKELYMVKANNDAIRMSLPMLMLILYTFPIEYISIELGTKYQFNGTATDFPIRN